MPEETPRLAAVPDEPEACAEAGRSPASGRRGGRLPFWILAAALVLCALGWFFQARESRELAASLEATRTALGRAQAELRAYDQHLSQIRDRLGALGEQLDSLAVLVEEGPRTEPEP